MASGTVDAKASVVARVRAALPRGGTLSTEAFAARQRTVLLVLRLHLPAILVFGLARGFPLAHVLIDESVLGLVIFAATRRALFSPRVRATLASVGLLTCSAILVHLADGATEMHFHFFVMIALIALYQDWLPFLVAIAFVALHHGVVGVLAPHHVFDHQAAWSSPWKWAAIHALFVLAASAAQVRSWRSVEDEHWLSKESLEASERRFRALIEHSLDAITVIRADGTVVYDSESVVKVLGHSADDRVGRSGLDLIHPDDAARVEAVFVSVLAQPGLSDSFEVRARHADGSWRWIDARMTNLLDEADVQGLVVNFRDVTDHKQLQGELSHQAFHDPLTGLANRALFLDRVSHGLATQGRVGSGCLAMLFIDLDDFKTVNDALGHSAGDELLKITGVRLSEHARLSDTCARLGGDEFGILLEGLVRASEAYDVAERLVDRLGEPVTIDGTTLAIGASVGIVVSDGTESAEHLVRNADLAMYQAKRAGKGRLEVFEGAMHDAALHRLELKEDLRRAIAGAELENHYQAIVDLASGGILGAEALVRWNHPDRGLLLPAEFIALAEETGLITDIGGAVLRQACRDAAGWPVIDGHVPTVSVNLSPRQLQQPGIVGEVADALTAAGLDAGRLTLEITESVLIDDPTCAAATLSALKDLGVSIALDDFGTGYSSLSYLARFPVDCLKIDKSFTDALVSPLPSDEASLIDTILAMCRSLKLDVTAEGVEEPQQVARLLTMGCAVGQGFHFARPVPNAALLRSMHVGPGPRDEAPASVS
ncbi:MAG: putative signaling protein [Acidimicrobiales bacterium]|nr:putative signaling protein [Acidimicrobiales bacterium]